ncbi:MAG: LexA repressor, partial [Luminiphilus sp.]|nr:LexA repressor [Luminiphilus sp.]
VMLLAENEDYAPIKVDLATQAFAIEGISVGVLRR